MTIRTFYYFFSYFAVALIISAVTVPLLRPISFRVGAVDRGTGRRVHTGIIPRLGGIGIFIAFSIPLAFSLTRGMWDDFHQSMAGILIGSTAVLCVGAWDDLRGATVRNKLLAEVLAAVFIYLWGIRITVLNNPFGGYIALGALSLPVTILWIVVITNAINLIDGLDGLAAGTGILIAATFSLLPGTDMHLQLAYVILAGSLCGFLLYNLPPASIFMGDSGSLFLGFFLASTSVLSSHKATALATIMVPVIAFLFPLMDMFYAVVRRYYRGMPLGGADREHIHHKLLGMGLSKQKALLVLSLLNAGIMVTVLLIVRRQMHAGFMGLILIALVVITGLRLLGYVEFIPFIRDMQRSFENSRRSRYFTYLIKGFRHAARSARSADELRLRLDDLMREYRFSLVQIHLFGYDRDAPFYVYADAGQATPDKPLVLSFPIINSGTEVGIVHLTREMDETNLLCAADLVRAISEEIGGFSTRYPHSSPPT